MKHIAITTAAALTLAACAQSPDRIEATDVSPALYAGQSCATLNTEAQRINSRLADLTGRQQRASSNDAALTAVSLILFWPAAFWIGNQDHAPEIARLRGEAQAVAAAAQQRGC